MMMNRKALLARGDDLLGKVGRVLAWAWMKSVEPWVRVRSAMEPEDAEDETMLMKEMIGSRLSIQVQLGALITVFLASGLVPMEDAVYAVFVTAYTFLLSCRCAFPSYPAIKMVERAWNQRRKSLWRQAYIAMGTLLTFFLPLGFALGGFSRGNPDPARVATPHLFLTSSQLLSELVTSQYSRFSPPVRVILTLLYNTRRAFSLGHWIFSSHKYSQDMWVSSGRWLVVANFIYCNINIFCILIPRLLLRAFERYIAAKNAYYAAVNGRSGQSSTTLTKDGVLEDTTKGTEIVELKDDLDYKGKASSKRKGKGKEKEIQEESDKSIDTKNSLRSTPNLMF